MKPIASAIVAATLLALAAAPVAAAPPQQAPASQQSSGSKQGAASQQSQCNTKPAQNKKQNLSKGKCFDGWKQKKPVADYGKRGLKAPGKGRQWIENNGSYVLVEITTGIIQQIVNFR